MCVIDIMEESSSDSVFGNDPLYMKSLIGKKVQVLTVEKTVQEGTVYVIDPIFKTLVVFCKLVNGNGREYNLFPYHAIKNLKILSDDIEDDGSSPEKEPSQNYVEQKEHLKSWFRYMFINFEEIGDTIKIDDHLIIVPPYGPDNCICNNTIVLERIQNLITMMPEEFT